MEPSDLIRGGEAQRLAIAREQSGREAGELAWILDISYEAYRDLEHFDEEIVDALSFDQLIKLADAIRLNLRCFFDAESLGHVTFGALAARLQPLAATRASLAALEERVGWELRRYLDDPLTFSELPAIALAGIAAAVGVDWRCLLPLDGQSRTNDDADRTR